MSRFSFGELSELYAQLDYAAKGEQTESGTSNPKSRKVRIPLVTIAFNGIFVSVDF